MMKTARELAFLTLKNTASGVKLDDAIYEVLSKNAGLDSRDERFFLQLVKATVRNRSLLDYQIEKNSDRPLEKIDPEIVFLLRMGILQLHLMETAEHAAVNETVNLAKITCSKKVSGFVNAIMRSSIRNGMQYPNTQKDDSAGYLSVIYSHPRWLVERWFGRFGYEETEELLTINNTPAPTAALLRPATEIVMSGDCIELPGGKLLPGPFGTFEIRLESRLRDFQPFSAGDLLIVDPSSTLGVRALSPPSGAVVGDFASGVGGKTVQLAWGVGDGGKVVAVDNDTKRMQGLLSNIEKYNLTNVSPVFADLTSDTMVGFDYILLDVPCSNSGVLRRKPDIRWRLRPEDIDNVASLQKRLLRSAFTALNDGGLLVYETCSMEPEENEDAIWWAVDNLDGAVIEDAVRLLEPPLRDEFGEGPFIKTYPHKHNCNGAFVAALRRA